MSLTNSKIWCLKRYHLNFHSIFISMLMESTSITVSHSIKNPSYACNITGDHTLNSIVQDFWRNKEILWSLLEKKYVSCILCNIWGIWNILNWIIFPLKKFSNKIWQNFVAFANNTRQKHICKEWNQKKILKGKIDILKPPQKKKHCLFYDICLHNFIKLMDLMIANNRNWLIMNTNYS